MLESDLIAERKMVEFLSPKAGRLYPSPHCEITDTLVVFDDSDATNGNVLLPEGHTNDVWLRGCENFRVLLMHNPVNLNLELVIAILAKNVTGALWMFYPWSGTSSSMMPVLQKKNNLVVVLGKLSVFHQKIKEKFKVVHFIIEMTTVVSLHGSPPYHPGKSHFQDQSVRWGRG